jgi:hypothetical protein
MNEKDIIEFYRKQVDSLDEAPPEIAWEEISTRLDIEESWDNISAELDSVLPVNNDIGRNIVNENIYSSLKTTLLISSLVVCLLLFLSDNRRAGLISTKISAGYPVIVPDDQPLLKSVDSEIFSGSEKNVKTTKVIADSKKVGEQLNLKTENTIKGTINYNSAETIQVSGSSIKGSEEGISAPKTFPVEQKVALQYYKSYSPPVPVVLTHGQQILSPPPVMQSTVSLIPRSGNTTGNISPGSGTSHPGSKINLKRFSIGISLSEKNTWLINQETFEGLDRQELNSTRARFQTDFGIILRYAISERWSLDGTSFFSSKTGQSYNQYLNGIYSTRIYELNYYSFEVNARYAIRRSPVFTNIRSYPLTGVYISHLSSAYESIDNSQFNISRNYDPIDYGIILGYELEIPVFARFAVTPGIRIKCGIPNIFADQPGIPDDLHSTRIASFEFRLNLIFPLSNK